jgi:hypothetical protein
VYATFAATGPQSVNPSGPVAISFDTRPNGGTIDISGSTYPGSVVVLPDIGTYHIVISIIAENASSIGPEPIGYFPVLNGTTVVQSSRYAYIPAAAVSGPPHLNEITITSHYIVETSGTNETLEFYIIGGANVNIVAYPEDTGASPVISATPSASVTIFRIK